MFFAAALVGGDFSVPLVGEARFGARRRSTGSSCSCRSLGEIWLKYQVAQFSRILSTLLTGGIPLVQAMETAADSLGTPLLRGRWRRPARACAKASRFPARSRRSKMFPGAGDDMIEVGESTGALPAMLNSVAEFFEEDVNTKMTATLSLIEPAIMIVMGVFVAFVLIALYLPIFSLADTIR